MLLWNCVPWIVHARRRGRPLRRAEIRGLATLPGLLAVLPRLTTVVLAGRVAREAAPVIAAARPNVALFTMPHPSPANVCTSPAVPAAIRDALSAAAARLGSIYKEGVSLKGSRRRYARGR
jgi:uracil-DNA glycosylase